MSAPKGYIHGYSDDEAERLLAQARFLAPFVIEGLPLDGVTRVLEVGVGVGAETQLLRARWPELRITGVDVSQGSLERAHQTLRDQPRGAVELLRASGAHLPFADGEFEAALFIWVLEHVPDPQAVLRDVARCLQPGGRVIAAEVYNRTLLIEPRHAVIDDYFEALNEVQRRGGGHPDIAPRLPEMIARAGLELVEFRLTPVLGDARDPAQRTALIRYFEGIFRSAEPQIRAAGGFDPSRISAVWRAFDEVVASPDALLSYAGGRVVARKR
jgi:ubiquinone/menaquinone biosynthesis C-methylase UbiE